MTNKQEWGDCPGSHVTLTHHCTLLLGMNIGLCLTSIESYLSPPLYQQISYPSSECTSLIDMYTQDTSLLQPCSWFSTNMYTVQYSTPLYNTQVTTWKASTLYNTLIMSISNRVSVNLSFKPNPPLIRTSPNLTSQFEQTHQPGN